MTVHEPPAVTSVAAPSARRPRSQRAATLRWNLCASSGDAVSYSVMVGLGETYLPAFVLAIGLGEVASGLITTVPLFAGAVLQMVSPWGVRALGSNRRWVLLCSVCQALALLPLCLGALSGSMPLWTVFLVASICWAGSLGTGPAWNTWMGSIVPGRLRAKYFAVRSRMGQVGVLTGFLLGGLALNGGQATAGAPDHRLVVFALLFLLASVCRFISVGFLASQSEPIPPGRDQRRVPAIEMLRRLRGGDGRLLAYLLCVQTAVQIAGPYFTPFMLKTLEFSYFQYALLIAISFGVKIAALPIYGNLAHRLGARALLWIGGLGIVPMSALWLLSSNFRYLMFVQVFAGLAWGAYELAMFLLFFETIPAHERTSVLTTFNLANAAALVVGSFIGAAILGVWGKTAGTYLALFGISSLARAMTVIALVRVPRFSLAAQPIATRTLGMRPEDAALDQPVLPSLGESRESGE